MAAFLPAHVLAQDVTALFPDASQVVADYPDPVQSYVALNLLWDTSHALSASQDAIKKRAGYYDASTRIRQQRLFAGDKAATDFDSQVLQLRRDASFRSSVLEKYHLANVAAAPPSQVNGPLRSHDVTDAMIKGAAAKAAPIALLTLIVMIFIVRAIVRNTANASMADGQLPADRSAPLPESLGVVRLTGMQYALGVLSGRVIDKETTLKTSTSTTVTSGQVYSMGGEIHTTPGQVVTSSVTTQTDLIWIETPDGQETSWTFTGGAFKARAGHVISVIARPLAGSGTQFLMACNHATRQLQVFGYGAAHATRRGFLAWVISALVGAAGFALAFGIFLSIQPPEQASSGPWIIYPASLYIEGLVASGILGAIITIVVKARIWRKRNAQFEKRYLPQLKDYLQQRTALPLEFKP